MANFIDQARDNIIDAVNRDLGECSHTQEEDAACADCLRLFFKKYVPPYLKLVTETIRTYGYLEATAPDSKPLHRLRRVLRLHGFDPKTAKEFHNRRNGDAKS